MKRSVPKILRFVFVFTFLILCFGCNRGNDMPLPEGLLGVWKTAEPRYKDRSFEIRRKWVFFRLGEGQMEVGTIDHVEGTPVEDKILVSIFYKDQDKHMHTFSFYFNSEMGAVTFKHQKNINWKKEVILSEG